jgi:hypothetical protein
MFHIESGKQTVEEAEMKIRLLGKTPFHYKSPTFSINIHTPTFSKWAHFAVNNSFHFSRGF